MAHNNPLTSGNGTGGTAAMRERTIDGVAVKSQGVHAAVATTLVAKTVSVTTTAAVNSALAADPDRVLVVISPLDGDIYIGDATGSLAADTGRRKVRQGDNWSNDVYVGDIAWKGVSGSVSVEIEVYAS